MAAQHLCGVGDLAFTGQEHQDVAVTGAHQLVGGVADRLRLVDRLLPGPALGAGAAVAAAGRARRASSVLGSSPRRPDRKGR